MEMSLYQSLLLSFSSPMIFVERPIAPALLMGLAVSLAFPLLTATFRRAARGRAA